MSSFVMEGKDSDEEVDLETLRLAALKSRKPKYAHVNHSNLIPIVPVTVETPDFLNTKIKKEKASPTPVDNSQEEKKEKGVNKENEDDKASNYSESTVENDQDILSMDDKEEEDSLERLMDQLEAEISGKAPEPTNKSVTGSKTEKKNRKTKKSNNEGDDEIELVQVKTGREPGAIIEIRESASPENISKETNYRKSGSLEGLKSPLRRSRSRLRSRSPYTRGRNYRRSRSPYWSTSPRRSRSPFRRSRSPFWMSRCSRSGSRLSRSPVGRYRSPGRKRSPLSRFSRSRSRSFDRRRSPWSISPRRRSKSPFYRDSGPPYRRRNFNSPPGRSRRSFSPRGSSKSPRRRSRSPRRFPRDSPFRRSKSPFRRSPIKRFKSPVRRSQSPYLRRSKSPTGKLNSPLPNRSPLGMSQLRHSNSPRGSVPKSFETGGSKPRSPTSKFPSPGRRLAGKDARSLSFSTSPTPRRNRSPLRVVEKNKLDGNDKTAINRDRSRSEKRHRSLSRENNRTGGDRRPYKQRRFRRRTPPRSRRSPDRQTKRSKSPKPKEVLDKNKESSKLSPTEKEASPSPAAPTDPVLEARKKKFESLGEVDPTVDKKISLKSIKESTENVEDDEDALTINVEGNLWDESEESEDDFDSRFKSNDARQNRGVTSNRTVLSFRNLREADASRKINLNKPLSDDNRRDRFGRGERSDRWQQGRKNDRNGRRRRYPDETRSRSEGNDSTKTKSRNRDKISSDITRTEKRSDRKPIVWSSKNERKVETSSKGSEMSATQSDAREDKNRNSENTLSEIRDKPLKNVTEASETDDFDKLISDFEKELESDICIPPKESNSAASVEGKRPKITVNVFDNKESAAKRPPKHVKVNDVSTIKIEKEMEIESTNRFSEGSEKVEIDEMQPLEDGPEDYIEDDDFELEMSARQKQKTKGEDEDAQSDLRAVLSRRRNERLTKAVTLQENMPTRLVQSAFQGLGNKKSKTHMREVQDSAVEFSLLERNVKPTGVEGRRVLLLQREMNPSVPSVKLSSVPKVKPDTTLYQRFSAVTRSTERRKRKLQRQLDPIEDMDQEEEEEGFEMREEKQSRRFRLKRNVTLSSQL